MGGCCPQADRSRGLGAMSTPTADAARPSRRPPAAWPPPVSSTARPGTSACAAGRPSRSPRPAGCCPSCRQRTSSSWTPQARWSKACPPRPRRSGCTSGVYEAYDAGAVVHTHAPAATAVSCVFEELPAIHYEMLGLGGAIRVAPYTTFGTPELAASAVGGAGGANRRVARQPRHRDLRHGPRRGDPRHRVARVGG